MKQTLLGLATAVDLTAFKQKDAEPVVKNETAVGVISDDLKRLYVLLSESCDAVSGLNSKILDATAAHSKLHEKNAACEEECTKHATEITALIAEVEAARSKADQLKKIFWAAARLEFPDLLEKPSIGVREGFTLVYKTEENESAPAFFAELEMLGEMLLRRQQR